MSSSSLLEEYMKAFVASCCSMDAESYLNHNAGKIVVALVGKRKIATLSPTMLNNLKDARSVSLYFYNRSQI